ncbi:MAG TPA: D-hexose-6-phosphate mutarotase, partial [Dongiaceae bacterium]|nr:D-hexose-6-phosphate mutarotase [Dongiaceae bacterium]
MPNPTPGTNALVTLQQIDELPCLRIQHPRANALIALQGAQVLEFTPAGKPPVIWLSPTAAFKRGQSVRGGIPVCWPWFGDLTRNPQAVRDCLAQGDTTTPAHGWVRSLPWLLQRVDADGNGVHLRLDYPTPTGLSTSWAHHISLSLDIHIGERLQLTLTTHNHGITPLTLSQALHSYFAVSHIDQVQVKGLEQVRYLDTLQQWQEKRDAESMPIQQETDRIYLETPSLIRIEDSGWKRALCIESQQSRSAVVWNPWIEKAQRLSQFPDDAYQQMLCIETARVMDDCL